MKTTVQRKPKPQKKGNGGVNLRQATSSLKVYENANSVNGGPVRSVPAAMGSMKVTGRPKTENARNGDCRIVHREYLGEVSLTTSFSSTKYSINPGLPQSFPWLSSIAQRYESYRFEALKFCYETSSPSSQAGTVLLVPDYDSLDSAPSSKVQALAYRNSARAQPWLSFCQTSSREDLSKRSSYYVRNGNPPSGSDLRLYDVGNLFLCVQGDAAPSVGELWVEYDIRLMTPQLEDDAVSAKVVGSTGVTNVAPFGSAPVTTGTLQITPAGSTITFLQAWEGMLTYQTAGTSPSAPTISGTGSNSGNTAVVGGAGDMIGFVFVRCQAGQTIVFDFSGSIAITGCTVYLSQYDW